MRPAALEIVGDNPETRPETLNGCTIRVQSPYGKVYVTLNETRDGVPVELFLNIGKCGSDVAADAEAIGRLCSLLLRLPSPVASRQRIEWIQKNLDGIGGSRNVDSGTKRIRSLAEAVSLALSCYLERRLT